MFITWGFPSLLWGNNFHLIVFVNKIWQCLVKCYIDSNLDLSVFEATDQFLVAKYISICKCILNVCKKGMILRQLHEPVCKHCLVEKVLRALNIIPILVLNKARLRVSVYSNCEIFALVSVYASGGNYILE